MFLNEHGLPIMTLNGTSHLLVFYPFMINVGSLRSKILVSDVYKDQITLQVHSILVRYFKMARSLHWSLSINGRIVNNFFFSQGFPNPRIQRLKTITFFVRDFLIHGSKGPKFKVCFQIMLRIMLRICYAYRYIEINYIHFKLWINFFK